MYKLFFQEVYQEGKEEVGVNKGEFNLCTKQWYKERKERKSEKTKILCD